ncbi:hypothetical protein [Sphingomonas gilva]|uniref:hypothetical protein n=1 Tax=Sphingomonas gilva TaxID=2305907 RepID=UPI0015F7BCE4|nr:hypothetical protein [Sphingomonas gilva]
MLVLIDNNFADRDGMRDYLAASRSNLAALPGTVFEEWFKARSPDTTRRVQQIACAYPDQIVVLKDTRDLLHMSGQPRGLLLRLIDRKQTRDFAPYCETVVNAALTPELEAHFRAHRDNAQDTLAALLPEAHKMKRMFAAWDAEFSESQRRELKGIVDSDAKLSPALQEATFLKAVKLGGNLFSAHQVARSKVPATIFLFGVVARAHPCPPFRGGPPRSPLFLDGRGKEIRSGAAMGGLDFWGIRRHRRLAARRRWAALTPACAGSRSRSCRTSRRHPDSVQSRAISPVRACGDWPGAAPKGRAARRCTRRRSVRARLP